jgi:predicted GH43/DUF377 family glycosyl hydrolase
MNMKTFFLQLLGMIISCTSVFAYVDLEEGIQDFVIDTKRIEVPGYPHAFNPSIIRWQGKLMMTFRYIPHPDPKRCYNADIGVVWLDEDFNPISTPQILDLCPPGISPLIPSRAEDGHLINVGGTLYMIYDDNRDEKITKGGFRVYVTQLDVVGQKIIPHHMEALTRYPGESPNIREKNWVPFSYQDELLLVYCISPHRIFRYFSGTGSCETIFETYPDIDWKWGILRGSTPALNIDNHYYLSFFHSSIKMTSVHSQGKEVLHYFTGAYLFSLNPPFEILAISPEPIVGKNFYHGQTYKPYWHPLNVVFPGGYICEGDKIYVFYGRQDHEMWVATIDKKGLLDSLIPVSPQK